MDALYGTVVRTEQLSPRMVRVVFGGDGLRTFASTGFTDEYVNAQFLPEDAPYSVPFDVDALKAEPREIQPRGRRETVRRWNPQAGELTLDIVTHGDEGFAGRFASRAREGDRLQMLGPSGGYSPRPDADWHLLIGDESALPAIAAALDGLDPVATARVVAVVDGAADRVPLECGADVEIVWVLREEHQGDPDALLHAVEDLVFPVGDPHAFVHGEAGEVRAIRKHLFGERGIPREDQSISPYWRREHTDEQWRQIKRQWLADSALDV